MLMQVADLPNIDWHPLVTNRGLLNLEFQLLYLYLPVLSKALPIRAMAAGLSPRPLFPVS
jgi:hypothetical protein